MMSTRTAPRCCETQKCFECLENVSSFLLDHNKGTRSADGRELDKGLKRCRMLLT